DGATVSRQVTAGADMGFYGTFITNGRLNIVEVKYVRTARALTRIRETLDELVRSGCLRFSTRRVSGRVPKTVDVPGFFGPVVTGKWRSCGPLLNSRSGF